LTQFGELFLDLPQDTGNSQTGEKDRNFAEISLQRGRFPHRDVKIQTKLLQRLQLT
jgi:hypothetical protein